MGNSIYGHAEQVATNEANTNTSTDTNTGTIADTNTSTQGPARWSRSGLPADYDQSAKTEDMVVDQGPSAPTRPSYEPSADAVKAFETIVPGSATSANPIVQEAPKPVHDLDTVVSIDLLDFDARFPCKVCEIQGDTFLLSVVTISDHMSGHKYEMNLAERLAKRGVLTKAAEIGKTENFTMEDIKQLIPGIRNAVTDMREEVEADDEDTKVRAHERARAFDEREDDEESYNAAIRESAMEKEVMGTLSEDDAIAAAIAASQIDNNAAPPVVTAPQIVIESASRKKTLVRKEMDSVDTDEVNCD